MIDSHCHIGMGEENIEQVIQNALNSGVSAMLSVACNISDYRLLLQLLDDYPMVFGAFGIHPESAGTCPSQDEFKKMIMAHPKLVGVGEMGLDYHYMTEDKTTQQKAFEYQIEMASQVQKPIIIHTREADEDTVSILRTAYQGGLLKAGGVLHCFTGTDKLAEKALEFGLYISASGVITFKNAEAIRSVFQIVPIDRLLVETDSPYMAPVPYRGKENQPAYVVKTAEKLAEIKGIELSEVEQITTKNFNNLFNIMEVKNED